MFMFFTMIVSRMSRSSDKGGGVIVVIIVFIVVFYEVYNRIVNPYSNPVSIIQNLILGVWYDILSLLISHFGLETTAFIIALVAGVAFYKKGRKY